MFDENTIISFGPEISGKTIGQALEDRLACRHWLALAKSHIKTEEQLALYNHIGHLIDEEWWVDIITHNPKDLVNADYVITFGQFKGRSIIEIPQTELCDYCEFLFKKGPDAKAQELLQKMREYMASKYPQHLRKNTIN